MRLIRPSERKEEVRDRRLEAEPDVHPIRVQPAKGLAPLSVTYALPMHLFQFFLDRSRAVLLSSG